MKFAYRFGRDNLATCTVNIRFTTAILILVRTMKLDVVDDSVCKCMRSLVKTA